MKKLFRVRDYDRDQLVTLATLPLDTYFPGDKVNGKIKTYKADGSTFTANPNFDYYISFDSGETISMVSQQMTLEGEGTFSFTIPQTTK